MPQNDFFDRVIDVVKKIPCGRVTTFGSIANYLGSNRSARLVGWALNKCNNREVPAHRVVNKKGLLTGKFHFDGTTLMQDLLESEGVGVIQNQIQDLEKILWEPINELN